MDKSVLRTGFSGHQQLGDEDTQQFVTQPHRGDGDPGSRAGCAGSSPLLKLKKEN